MRLCYSMAAFFTSILTLIQPALAGCPKFTAQTIDPRIGAVCYAVTKADVNGDGKLDIVAVSENRLQWYEAPTWKKHVILDNQTEMDNVCIAVHDVDGDGKIDFALGAGWIKTNTGSIQWVTRGEKPEDPWTVHLIAHEKSTHRMSFADVLGEGQPQLVVSPLNRSIDGNEGVRLLAFSIPKDPKMDRWIGTPIDETLNRVHGHTHADWDGDGTQDTLTASEEGLFVIHRPGNAFLKRRIGSGAESPKPELRGAGEIKLGKTKQGKSFVATVEPMHGTSVAVYTESKSGQFPLERRVIESELKQGHAVWTADLDGDGGDEIWSASVNREQVRLKGPGLYVFSQDDPSSQRWTRHVIDNGGIAVEDALIADFNGDGKLDLLAGGRATQNVKLYLNRGQ